MAIFQFEMTLYRCSKVLFMVAFFPKSLNPAKLLGIRANCSVRDNAMGKMLDETYEFLKSKKSIKLDELQDYFEKKLPGIDINVVVAHKNMKYDGLLDPIYKRNGKPDGFAMRLKSDYNGEYALTKRSLGLLMHETTHFFDLILNPKKNKLLKALNNAELGRVQKSNYFYENYIYGAEHNFSKGGFKDMIDTVFEQIGLTNNHEKIQHLKQYYTKLKMEQAAYASSAKYGAKADEGLNIASKLEVLKEELVKAINLERQTQKIQQPKIFRLELLR